MDRLRGPAPEDALKDGGLCRKPVLRDFLPNSDVITEEDMVLVCSSVPANHHERQNVSMSWWSWRSVLERKSHAYKARCSMELVSGPKMGVISSHSTAVDRRQVRSGEELLETCTSSVRVRQYMTREHKRRHPRPFELNSGEN